MDTPDDRNFADYPESISEKKSGADGGNAALMKPRDALIAALRRIDSGELSEVDAIVICVRRNPAGKPGVTETTYFNCSPDIEVALGMLAEVQWAIRYEAQEA